MIKYISYMYMVSVLGGTANTEYCEVKDLHSPYVKNTDESTVAPMKDAPVIKCDSLVNDSSDTKAALIECLKIRKEWLKI
jgi:hypothetical protein